VLHFRENRAEGFLLATADVEKIHKVAQCSLRNPALNDLAGKIALKK